MVQDKRVLDRNSVLFEEMELSADGRTIKSFEDIRVNLKEDCRICLRRCNEACQLFQNDKGFSQKLMAFAAVQVEEGDGLPSVICYHCSQLLDMSYNFQCQIQKADTKLRGILKLGSCMAKNIESVLKVEDNFSDIVSNTILHKRVTDNINNDVRTCSNSIDEPSVQLDVQSFSNDQHVFTSEIINDNIESNDKCNSIIVLENKQKTYKVVENVKLPQSCEKITNKSNNLTCHSPSLITETDCVKEELSHKKHLSESDDNSIDQSTVSREQIFKIEIKDELHLEELSYNTLAENSSKNINIQEEGKPIDNCSDDEEKPLISRTSRQKCLLCIKSFATRLALQRHMIVHKHKTKLRYVCYICDKQFSNIAKLKNHIFNRHDTHENNKKREKENSEDKDVHLKTEHLDSNCNNSIENTKTEKKNCKFTCKVCSKQFTYQKSFFTHAKSHPEYNSEDLNDISSETGTQLNEIKSKSVLKQSESDDGNNDDIDDIDNDDDNDNDNDNDNLPMENPQCTQCGKLFATKRNLKRHISTHSGLKYNCSTCGKGFSRIDKLKDHEQSKHKDEIFGNSEEENEDDTDNENKVNGGSNDRKKQLSNSTTTFTLPMDNTLQQNGGPTPQVLIYSQRKLVEDGTVGQVTPSPQYMIANVHNQKALSTNIMQPFTVEDPNSSDSLGFYSDLENLGVFYISGQDVVSSTPAEKLDMPAMAMQKMRRQGQDVMQMNLAGIRRDIVNLAHNYSNAQKAVRKATSNDPWGPSSTLMAEIADLTYNVVAFTEIMQMLWKRLNDHGKNWRHVYKALVLLEYLIKTGTEKVAQQCKENIFAIQTLKDFQHMEGHKDQGINVREKAKQLVALLKDDERLKNERARALKAKERFAQTVNGFGSDGLDTMSPVSSDFQDWEPCNLTESASRPELEAARPQTVGEEELQLQLALAMSREEAEQEEQRRRSDDVRLQLALSQSQQDFKAPQTEKQSHMLDLLDVNLGEASGSSAQNDPWSIPVTVPPPRPQTQNDPWSVPTTSNNSPAIDPWAPVTSQKQVVVNDPWKAPAPSPATIVTPRTADPWSPIPSANESEASKVEARQDKTLSTSPSFNNPTLIQNIGFAAQSPQNIGFNLPNSSNTAFGTISNGFKDPGSTFNNFSSQTHGSSAASPLSELDEFDVISQRNKLGAGSQTANNVATLSSDPFDLSGIGESLPQSTGAIKKTPQSFLGENSALVNLDNLVSTSTIKTVTPTPTVPVSYSANPFATTAAPSHAPINQIRQDPWAVNTNAKANPFLS
ncbi:zinc finger protein 93-like isoform X1 [Vespula maculifrons]|uniref:Zinc finger protein 93-like isoform X1 n=1 Tax=Vespula maculifrons TaxID=7453 RepID=A0ABD2ANL5_VESMC